SCPTSGPWTLIQGTAERKERDACATPAHAADYSVAESRFFPLSTAQPARTDEKEAKQCAFRRWPDRSFLFFPCLSCLPPAAGAAALTWCAPALGWLASTTPWSRRTS